MKYFNLALLALTLPLASSFAETHNHPCKEVKKACESAGFTRGGHKEKKGLYIDCMKPLKEGKSVPGVTVEKSILDACIAKKEHRDEEKK